ncbi:hypothetical protein GE061_001112 [Apolygus lucorum]|uniref:Uncharacterized protein n=1 Tax=Apolygus lucorum TaxID=248454 RepID=A0A8S9Y6F1_APOLU|nr:hypothetical protein GE061_001112 [Apolygus lucorum]
MPGVKCNFCGIVLGKWREFDNPQEEHRRWSPNCIFVDNPELTKNVSDITEDLSKEGGADDDEAPQCKALARQDTFDGRYETFRRWPKVLHHLVNELASAGFHYSGQQGDLVYCYACEGGIQDWEMQDDPWVEHARKYEDCPHVQNVKGSAYVASAKRCQRDSVWL